MAEKIVRYLVRRRGAVLGIGAVLVAAGIFVSTGLEMGQDVSELLPSLPGEDRRALDFISRSSLFDRMYVEVSGADTEVLAGFASRLADMLETVPGIGAVESRVRPEEERAAASLIFGHRFHLLRASGRVLDELLGSEGIAAALALDRARLLGPMAMASGSVPRDPLGLADRVRKGLSLASASGRVRMYRGLAFTPDLDRCLLRLRTDSRALRVDDAGALVDRVRGAIDAERRSGPFRAVVARVTGAHVFSSESARIVKKDVTLAFGLATAGILLLLWVCFRRPVPVVAALLPSAAGVLAGFAVSRIVLGRMSGIAVGYGSIVVGIAVDYSIHYLQERLASGPGPGVEARVLGRIAPSLVAGFLTTLVVFAVYGVSSFPLIRELGVFAGSGVTAGFLVSVLIVPLLPASPIGEGRAAGFVVILPDAIVRPSRGRAIVTIVAAAAIVAAGAALATRLTIDDDVRRLDFRSPETSRFASEFEKRWLGQQEGRVVVARGRSLEEALVLNDAVAEALRKADIDASSLSGVLPSAATQRASLSALLHRDWASIRSAIESEADALGFASGTFEPFFHDLERARRDDPPPLTERDLAGTPMAHLAAGAIVRIPGEVAILTFLPGGHLDDRAPALLAGMRPHVVVTSRVEVMNRVFGSVRSEVLRLSAISLLAILLVLLLRYRRIWPAAVAMVPVIVACASTAGLLALSGMAVNAIAALSFTLILGVGLDYGIFMLDAMDRGASAGLTGGAVLFSGLTTTASFGVLALCRSPVLRSTGIVVLAGVLASLAAALVVVPAMKVLAQARGGRS